MRATPSFTSRMVPSSSTSSSERNWAISFFRTEVISSGLILMDQLASWLMGQHALLDLLERRAQAGVGHQVAVAEEQASQDRREYAVDQHRRPAQLLLQDLGQLGLQGIAQVDRRRRLDVHPADRLVV